jgi:hypothetical protein
MPLSGGPPNEASVRPGGPERRFIRTRSDSGFTGANGPDETISNARWRDRGAARFLGHFFVGYNAWLPYTTYK